MNSSHEPTHEVNPRSGGMRARTQVGADGLRHSPALIRRRPTPPSVNGRLAPVSRRPGIRALDRGYDKSGDCAGRLSPNPLVGLRSLLPYESVDRIEERIRPAEREVSQGDSTTGGRWDPPRPMSGQRRAGSQPLAPESVPRWHCVRGGRQPAPVSRRQPTVFPITAQRRWGFRYGQRWADGLDRRPRRRGGSTRPRPPRSGCLPRVR